ncbi:MAG: ATP-binding protein [Bdellovibrionota bacterium]
MDAIEAISILLVDDREEGLVALEAVLDSPSYNLVKASSGQEALKHLLEQDFALILMDVQMPEMDGFQTAEIIKKRPKSKDIPIIFITAINKDEQYVLSGYKSGAVDYLFKPFDPSVLKSKVAVFVELYKQNKELKRQAEVIRESERVNRERALAQLEIENLRRYQSLADAIPHAVWRSKADGTLDYFNKVWCTYTGLTFEQSLGNGWQYALHPYCLKKVLEHWNKAMQDGLDFEVICQIRRAKDQNYRWNIFRAVAERRNSGQIAAWIGTFTDIHDQKLAEETLNQNRIALQQAVEARDEFLSIASHELKTPLTSLKLQLQLLHRKARSNSQEALSNPAVAQKLEAIDKQVLRLTALIESLLDVARIQNQKLQFDFELVDLSALVSDVSARFLDEIKSTGSILRVEVPDSATGVWDKLRLEQVLSNLLSNAVKYGGNGPIDVKLTVDEHNATLIVADRGIGISEENKSRIFQRFERLRSATNVGGLGLGLYIVHQIVEGHNGIIQVESELDRGSTFIITLPRRLDRLSERAPAHPQPETSSGPSARSALVAS